MRSLPRLPAAARFRPILLLGGWYLLLGTVSRSVLWAAFGRSAGVDVSSLGWILPGGAVGDAIEALYLLAPFALFLWLCPDEWYRSRGMRRALLGGLFLWTCGLLFVAGIEYYFFAEFDARFNLVSVDYLIYPTEVAGDITSEYPVGWLLLGCALLAAASTALLARGLLASTRIPVRLRQRTAPLLLFAVAAGLAVALFPTGTFARSDNRVANELAANGPSSFFRALRTSEIDYDTYYATRAPADNLASLARLLDRGNGRFTRLAEGRIDRTFPARSDGLGRLNVVLVSSESFGAEFSHLYGSQHDWTPEFDRLAQHSLWFRHVYASGTRTVRGLEALTLSIPPIPTESILRRPGNEHLATLGGVLTGLGYSASFLYGGYGYFDNMNAFYAANGYTVLDRRNLQRKPRFANIWGAADEDLFDMALAHADALAASGQPFFIHVMTTSNHKPYTFRTGLEGIGVRAAHGGRESGVRYADYAQGYFLRAAARHRWFDDTIFIIVADHGARAYGRAELPLRTYEIPLLIYSPRHIAPRRVDGLMTQIDVAPTLLGLLGLPYTAPWFGQDVLHTPQTGRIAYFSHDHDVALLRGTMVEVLGLRKTASTWRYDPITDRFARRPQDTALRDQTIACYQTAYELFRSHRYDLSGGRAAPSRLTAHRDR
ncbi:MAG: LTA synthase family protein [Gammaproteobacteria bacterium]|nr:LTA synthase family protein [Gammaproteobacteria bacterium]